MHGITFPLRNFWNIVHKLYNTIDPRMQYKLIEADMFEAINVLLIYRIRPKRIIPSEIRLNNRWIESFNNSSSINNKKKNIIKIDRDINIKIKTYKFLKKAPFLKINAYISEEGNFSQDNDDTDNVSTAPTLTLPNEEDDLILESDAGNTHWSAILKIKE